jgi:integrase
MRCIANLLWKYAIDKNVIDRNVSANLYTGDGIKVQREPLTDYEESVIKSAIGRERYAEYVYCLCWLGYRPGEMLQLRKDQLFCARLTTEEGALDVWYFVNGKKTDAGRDRVVVVPDEILQVIIERTYVPGTDLIFPQYCFSRKASHKLIRFKEMTDAYFREEVFKPMTQRLNIADGKVPYGGRHSYADKLKKATGSDKDKAALIGHSNYMFTQDKYQSTHLKDLYNLVNSFEKSDDKKQ